MPAAVACLRTGLVVAVALCAALLVLDVGEPVTRLLVPGLAVGAVVLLAARLALVPRERGAWGAAAAAVAFFAAGYVYWSLDLRHQANPPYPSFADAGWLAFYPLSYLGLGLLVRKRVARFQASVWLDGIIGSLAVASVGAALLLPVVLENLGGGAALVAVNLAYPLADIVMLAMVAGVLSFTGWKPGRVWLMLGVGFSAIAVADIAYLVLLAEGTYAPGTLLDLLWPAGLVVISLASWERHRRSSAVLIESWRTLVVPSALSMAALGVLVYGPWARVEDTAIVLAALTVLAVVLRTSMTFGELRALTRSRRLALTDELTGLGNRRLFSTRLNALVADARRSRSSVAVLVLDVDGFRDLNDTLGHESGDAVLQQLAQRLEQSVPQGAAVARLGGDEFGVALPSGSDRDQGEAVARRIIEVLGEHFHTHELLLRLTASVGIATFPHDAGDHHQLMQRVDIALHAAKERPGTYASYAAGRDATRHERLLLAQELRQAVERGQLTVHYQPQVDLVSGAIRGAEALVRWDHPTRGMISPGTFLPIAERTDLSRAITRTVVEQVADQLRVWRAAGHHFPVAINLAADDLLDDGFCAEVVTTLAHRGLTPFDVVLEVTEGIVMGDDVSSRRTLAELHAAGFALALDDFGTGHSSLSRLHDLPLAEIKIDRSFTARLLTDPAARSIVRSIADLSRNLDLRVLAEGPEDAGTVVLLAELGCEVGQGFWFARPLDPRAFDQWLADRAGQEQVAA